MGSEKTVEQFLKSEVEKLGGICFKFWPVSFTGLPDRIVLLPGGRIFFVELKAENKKPTPRQIFVHGQLKSLGFPVYVLAGKSEVTIFVMQKLKQCLS